MTAEPPLILANTVGLTERLLPHAPRLSRLAAAGWKARLREPTPAVTSTAQATLLTGASPQDHGIVANGWLFRDTMEVRFWQQSNRLLQREPFYSTARHRAARRGITFTAAKLFWWYNQGAEVDFSVTPKPWYGADGDKRFGIASVPAHLGKTLEQTLGAFPFSAFWGPNSGLPATQWIAAAAAEVVRAQRPSLTLVYLPHLDYDLQRHGPHHPRVGRWVQELDESIAPLEAAAQSAGCRLWIVNEYAHVSVRRPILLNQRLRGAGLLEVRNGPFGEQLDTFQSLAVAVCDHQLAHIYIRDSGDAALLDRAERLIAETPGVARVLRGAAKATVGLDHQRSGELVALAEADAWFAYPYWLDEKFAPDFARTVDIHRKPGFDPCELFFDPRLWWPKGRVLRRLAAKSLGFRALFDVVPLDPSLVGGSHGLPASDPLDRPLLLGDGPAPSLDSEGSLPMTAVRDLIMNAVGFSE